jgi:speckle-type POZ protein
MKMVCQGILCKSIDVKSVGAMLALADQADQHRCDRIKDACVEFLTSSNAMDDVVAREEYVHLKRSCPGVLLDIFERVIKSRKI